MILDMPDIQEKLSELANSDQYRKFIEEYGAVSRRFSECDENVKLLCYFLLVYGGFEEVSKLLPSMIFERTPVSIQEFFQNDKYGGEFNRTLRSTWRMELFDFFSEGSAYEEAIFTGAAGTGKAQPLSAKIKTPDGWTTMGEIKVGDIIDNAVGGTTKVIGVYPQGVKDIYKITLENNRSTECCKEHLWKCVKYYFKIDYWEDIVLTTEDLLDYLDNKEKYSNSNDDRFYLLVPYLENGIVNYSHIESINLIRQDIAQCIMVDSDEHLYVTDDYIVTHNTTISRYMILYTLYKICCLKNPQAVFGLSRESPLSIIFLSTTLDMARKISLLPFVEILSLCPIFERVKSNKELDSYVGMNIPYIYTDSESIIRFRNSISIEVGSGKNHLIGKNVLAAFLDEAELSGKADDVLELYAELGMRIRSRFKSSSFTFMSMISSAGMSNGVIAQYLNRMSEYIGKSIKVCSYTKWELDINVDPYENGHFWVFGGTTAHPSRIVEEDEAQEFITGKKEMPALCDLIKVPIEHKAAFARDIEKMLRDICGRNTQVSEILFPDLDSIEDPNLCPLIALESSVHNSTRLSTLLPASLFMRDNTGRKMLSRYPRCPRYVSVDLSLKAGSETAVCVLHKEDDNGEEKYVVDMLINITTPDKIRLEAIPELIRDLKTIYNVPIEEIILDQWQTETMIQDFIQNRVAKKVTKRSTSRSLQIVRVLSNLIAQDKVKVGKCNKLKKQLGSLAVMPEEDRLTYKVSKKQGIYDLSEVLMNAAYAAYQDKSVIPVNNYVEGRFVNSKDQLEDVDFVNEILFKYNLKI